MKASRCLWAPFLLLFLAIEDAPAQSAVEPRLEKLEEAIRVLERRVATLEEQLRHRAAAPTMPPDRASWRRLQKGMTEADVEKLLGSPSKVDAYGSLTVWRYGYPAGGQVRFDSRNLVNAWSEP